MYTKGQTVSVCTRYTMKYIILIISTPINNQWKPNKNKPIQLNCTPFETQSLITTIDLLRQICTLVCHSSFNNVIYSIYLYLVHIHWSMCLLFDHDASPSPDPCMWDNIETVYYVIIINTMCCFIAYIYIYFLHRPLKDYTKTHKWTLININYQENYILAQATRMNQKTFCSKVR